MKDVERPARRRWPLRSLLRLAPLGLRDRFILSSTALITLLMSVVIFFVEQTLSAVLERQARANGAALATAVADLSENRILYYDEVALQQNVERAADNEDVIFAIIFNREANTLAANETARRLFPAELFEMGAEMGRLERDTVLTGEFDYRTADGGTTQVLEAVSPVFIDDELWGAVKLGISLEGVTREINRLRIGLISLGFLGLTFGALGSVFLAERISRPLERLVEGTIRVAKGDLDYQIDISSRDEIGELARNFNQMTGEILEDRRKLKQASSKLVETEKLASIGRIATTMAHEIRNPLTAIKLNIQKVGKNPQLSELEREQVGIAESGILQVEKLVQDILSYARSPHLRRGTSDLRELILDAARFVSEQLEDKHARFETDFADLPPISVDGDRLKQVFLNILLNATEAIAHEGTVSVVTRLDSEGGAAVSIVEFIDDGSGIAPEDLDSIFKPFFTTKSLGTGLGLTNAKKIVELHDGTLSIESEKAQGTRVRIALPHFATLLDQRVEQRTTTS